MVNKIKFSHFCGTESKWTDNINSNKWDNTLVFGKIWTDTSGWVYKIYAGKVYVESSEPISYLYDVADANKLEQLKQDVIQQRLSINEIIRRLNNIDTSINGLKNDVFNINSLINNIDNRVTFIENKIEWITQ